MSRSARRISRCHGSFWFTEVSSGGGRRGPGSARSPSASNSSSRSVPASRQSSGRSRRLRAGRAARRGPARTGRPPRRPLVRRGRLAPRRGGSPEVDRLADGHRASCDAGRSGRSGGRRLRRRGRSPLRVGGDERCRGVPASLPRSGRLAVRPAHPASARPRPGGAGPDRRAGPVGGGDPARLPRRRVVP